MSDYSRFRPRPRFVRRSPEAAPAAAPPPTIPAYRTQVIPFWLIARAVQWGMWFACMLSFGISWLGNIGMFGGDLRHLVAGRLGYVQAAALVFGCAFLYQLVIQVGQFYAATRYGRSSRPYRTLVLFSVVPSLYSYGVVVIPWAGSAHLWGEAWPIRLLAYGGSAMLLFIVLWLNDAYQEQVLVRKAGV